MLTETRIRAAKASEKPYKLPDGRGLHLLVTPAGGRLWRIRYRFSGRESMLSLGPYPEIGLQEARQRREDVRRSLAQGIDPAAQRRSQRLARAETFKAIAEEWLAIHAKEVTAGTLKHDRHRLEDFLYPYIGSLPVGDVRAPDLLSALRRIETRGHAETAQRTRAIAGNVLRFAIATGRLEHDVTAGLRGALQTAQTRSYPAITDPVRIGGLLRAIDGYVGQPATHAALRLAPLLFVRPGELRAAEWAELDLDGAQWNIPGKRMKMGEPHLVPLSTQAVAILRDIELITGAGRFVFPSLRTPSRPISDNTLNAALRRLGYAKNEIVAHGFRAMASTLLNEQGYPPDVIELQLAHAERNEVRRVYNRAKRLEERRRMMQAWADYLDGLKAGGNVVVPFRRANA